MGSGWGGMSVISFWCDGRSVAGWTGSAHFLSPSSNLLAASTPATTNTSANPAVLTNSLVALAQCSLLARMTGLRGKTHTNRWPVGVTDSYTAPQRIEMSASESSRVDKDCDRCVLTLSCETNPLHRLPIRQPIHTRHTGDVVAQAKVTDQQEVMVVYNQVSRELGD